MSLYHWCQGYGKKRPGPKHGAYLYPHGVIHRINFHAPDSTHQVANAPSGWFGHALELKGIWSAQWRNPHNGTTWIKGPNIEALASDAWDLHQQEIEDERALKADPVRYLERELSCHDWYYDYSDDHRVWAGGLAHQKLIERLKRNVPPDVATALVNKYAPK